MRVHSVAGSVAVRGVPRHTLHTHAGQIPRAAFKQVQPRSRHLRGRWALGAGNTVRRSRALGLQRSAARTAAALGLLLLLLRNRCAWVCAALRGIRHPPVHLPAWVHACRTRVLHSGAQLQCPWAHLERLRHVHADRNHGTVQQVFGRPVLGFASQIRGLAGMRHNRGVGVGLQQRWQCSHVVYVGVCHCRGEAGGQCCGGTSCDVATASRSGLQQHVWAELRCGRASLQRGRPQCGHATLQGGGAGTAAAAAWASSLPAPSSCATNKQPTPHLQQQPG